MKPFQFQKFSIHQSKDVFRVGTDGVLLGAMATVSLAANVLEIGSGSGLISLMLAQRNSSAIIEAIDIQKDAVELSKDNFSGSIFSERLTARLQDFKTFVSEKKYDLVVCNPPFFEENSSVKEVLARQQIELNFKDLIEKTATVLTESGFFSVIIPAESVDVFTKIAKDNGLHLIRNVNIYGIAGGVLKRNILEFSLTPKPIEISEFVIEKSPRNYSDQYLELTKEFHVFKGV